MAGISGIEMAAASKAALNLSSGENQ